MPVPFEIIASGTAGAGSNNMTLTFPPPRAGRLLVAFYMQDPFGGGTREPDEPGWTTLVFFDPHYVYAKVSDGTETSFTISHGVDDAQTAVVIAEFNATLASIEGPETFPGDTAPTMVVDSGPVNLRFDFTQGGFADPFWPETGDPAELVLAFPGAAFRRSGAWWVFPLGEQTTGASIPGQTYTNINAGESFLLRLKHAWAVGFNKGT